MMASLGASFRPSPSLAAKFAGLIPARGRHDDLTRGAMLLGATALLLGPIMGYAVVSAGIKIVVAAAVVLAALWLLARRYGATRGGVALMLTVPYWYTVGLSQVTAFRVAALLALAGAASSRRSSRFGLVDVAIVAVVITSVLGWVLQDNQAAVGKIVLAEMLPVSFYIAGRLTSAHHVNRLIKVIAVGGAIGATTVIAEFLIGHTLFVDTHSYSWNETAAVIFRPGGIFGSPPGAATVLTLTILCSLPLLKGWRQQHEHKRTAAFYAVAVLIMFVACVLTFTRTALIALGIGLIVYLWLMRSSLITPTRVLIAAISLTAVVTFALPAVQHTSVYQRGFERAGNLAAREGYWSLAWPIITANAHNTVFGIGTARTIVPREGGTMPASVASAPELVEHGTHNQYVLTTLEEGFVGLLVVIGWIVATISTGVRTARRNVDHTAAALVGAVIAFAVIMLADNALLHQPSFGMAALATGLIVALRQESPLSDELPRVKIPH